MTGPLISVIFPVYQNRDEIAVTLPAILAQELPQGMRHEVVVVDDGSDAPVKEWLAQQDDPHLRLVSFDDNQGRSAARNAGVRAAQGDWVVFLDSDMIVRPDFLAAHARSLSQGADISLGRFADTDTLEEARHRRVPPAGPGGGFTSANVGLTRALLTRVQETPDGPFDAQTFTRYGWEDMDLEHRLNALSPRKQRTPDAIGFHICAPFTPDLLPAMIDKEIARAQMAGRFLAKHPTFAVRMVTQATPLHRLLWELLSLGGVLNARTLGPFLGWLTRRGWGTLASIIARNTILNPTYVRHLKD